MKNFFRALALIPLMILAAAPAFGQAIWAHKQGDIYSLNKSGVGITAADAFIAPTGIVWLGPGSEGFTLPSYRPGVCWIWQRYDGFRITGTPFEAWPTGTRAMRVDSSGVYVDEKIVVADSARVNKTSELVGSVTMRDTGIIPRLGPESGPTTGGAIRIVDGVTFPLTMAGVQAALDEVEAAGGGEVRAPTNLNITLVTTPLKIPNRTRMIFTSSYSTLPTFTANTSTNVVAAVMPKDTTGAQQTLWVEGLQIAGNRGSGGWIGAGLLMKGVYVGSQVRQALIRSCSGYGLKIDGGVSGLGVGQLWMEDIVVADNGDDNLLITGNADHIQGAQITSESPTTGNACIRIELGAGASANSSGQFFGVHMEGSAVADGIVMDRVSGWLLDGVVLDGGANFNSVVKITGTTTGSDGAFGAAGITIRNLRGLPSSGVLIDDQSAGVSIATSMGRFIDLYRSPKTPDDRITGQLVGIQPSRQRAAIASAATLVLPKGGWSDADVSGAVTVTAITGNDTFLFQTLCFWTSAAIQFTDGGNLNLSGNFVGDAAGGKDCLCGKWDGTNFNEVSRSLN